MLSKNLRKKTTVPAKNKKKKLVLSVVLVISIFFIVYGFYTFQKMKVADSKKTEATVQTGDRPLKQTLTVYVTGADGGLSLRKEPNKTSQRLAYIPNKTKLETIEELEGWYKVKYSGKEGWISKEYTTTQAPPEDAQKDWSYFTSKLGFKIKYPLGWKFQDYGGNAASQSLGLIAFSSQELPKTIPAGSDFIAPITVEASSRSLAEANKSFSSISGVVVEPITVNSIPATKYTYTSALSNTQMTGIVFTSGGKTFVLNEGGGYSEDLLKMANTFTLGG
jgi:hypothetical protein